MSAQNSASGPGVGPRRPPGQGQQQQAFPGANRYTLVDPGSGSASSNGSLVTPRADSRSPSRAAGRPPMRRGASAAAGPGGPGGAGAVPNGPAGAPPGPADAGFGAPKAPGPQTFAEMGITTTKVEDEKCVIM